MLLTGLERQHIGAAALRIAGLAHDAAGQFAHMCLAASHEAEVRAAVVERDAQALAVTDRDVGIPFGRGLEDGERRRIAILDQKGAGPMQGLGKSGQVLDDAVAVERRDDRTRDVTAAEQGFQALERSAAAFGSDVFQAYAGILGVGLDHGEDLGQQGPGQEYRPLLARAGDAHTHRFRRDGRSVIARGVGDIQARQGADHRLILEDVAQRTLRNLALVGRVGGQELRTGGDVRDDGRHVMVIGTGTDKHLQLGVHRSEGGEEVPHLLLRHRIRKVQFLLVEKLGGNVGIQLVHRRDPDPLQHPGDVFLRMGEIAKSGHSYWAMNCS